MNDSTFLTLVLQNSVVAFSLLVVAVLFVWCLVWWVRKIAKVFKFWHTLFIMPLYPIASWYIPTVISIPEIYVGASVSILAFVHGAVVVVKLIIIDEYNSSRK